MQINGRQVNVQISGAGDALIWSHGLMSSIVCEDCMGLFEWQDFPRQKRLIRYDARGHGRSEATFKRNDYLWRNLASDLISIADEVGVERFVAGGQSMGCATSLYAGLLRPERIEKLILVNPPTCWEARESQASFYKKMAMIGGVLGGKTLAKVMGNHLDRLLPGWLIEAKEEQVRAIFEGLKPLQRRTLYALFRGAAITNLPPKKELSKLQIPALILAWTDDPTHPVEVAEEMSRILPQSELVVAKGYDDFVQWPRLVREFACQ
jgi:pimeloyl-ACP methyl ester carboxylesterase